MNDVGTFHAKKSICSSVKSLLESILSGNITDQNGPLCLEIVLLTDICLRLRLHGAIYRPDSFVLMLGYCANLKAIRYEPKSLNRIVADKSHRVLNMLASSFFLFANEN